MPLSSYPLGKTLPYRQATMLVELPEGLRSTIKVGHHDGPQRRLLRECTNTDVWCEVLLEETPLPASADEILIPLRNAFQVHNRVPDSEAAWNYYFLPMSINSRTEYLTLVRLYEGEAATKYFVGQSQETGIFYWAEQAH